MILGHLAQLHRLPGDQLLFRESKSDLDITSIYCQMTTLTYIQLPLILCSTTTRPTETMLPSVSPTTSHMPTASPSEPIPTKTPTPAPSKRPVCEVRYMLSAQLKCIFAVLTYFVSLFSQCLRHLHQCHHCKLVSSVV